MGKTKDIINTTEDQVVFQFKDDACGENGQFEPGANQVALKIEGMGKACLLLTRHFFNGRLYGVPTHFISADVSKGQMTCTKLEMLPVEWIWRANAWGSFCKAYNVPQGTLLLNEYGNGLVETTLKDDALGDPRIGKAALIILKKLTQAQYEMCEYYVHVIARMLRSGLREHGYFLIDFKLEFGLDAEGKVVLADEVSPAIWRIMKADGTGKIEDPIEAAKKICPYAWDGVDDDLCYITEGCIVNKP